MKLKKQDNKKTNFKFNILAIICISIFVIGITTKTLQNDTFYTIKLGEYIFNNGIDMMEHFSWHEGLIYTYPHWLYDLFIYTIYNSFGFTGIYVSSIVLGIILGLSIYFITSKLSKNNLVSFFITILIMFLGRNYITARAQLITFILFVWTVYFIEMFLNTKKKKYAICLILIPIAIANIHAAVFPFYFVLYLPYIGQYIIALGSDIFTKIFAQIDKTKINKLANKDKLSEKEEKRLKLYVKRVEVNEEKLRKKREDRKSKEYKIIIDERKNTKWLILIMFICIFTGLITPIGDTPYTYLLHTMQGNTTESIAEHLPLVLFNNEEALIAFTISFILIAFTKTKIKLNDLFMFSGLIFLSFMSRRQFSMFVFIGGIILNNIVCDFIRMYSTQEDIEKVKGYITTVIGQVLMYVIVSSITICFLKKCEKEEIVNPSAYPIEASEYIINNLDLENIKLFNDYNYGSYLMYKNIPVFIDSRADVYDPKFNGLEDDIFKDYINIYGLNCYYEDKFEHYHITHIITYTNSKLGLYISKDSNYKQIYKDDHFVIFERLTH